MKNFLFCLFSWTAIGLAAQSTTPSATLTTVKVSVVNDKNQLQAGQAVTFISPGLKKYTGTTDATGKFSISLPPAQKYKVEYKIFNADYSDLSLDLSSAKGREIFTYQITVTPPKTFTLNDVLFDNGKSSLRPESGKELNQLAEYMSIQKTIVIEIAGHTDNVGLPDANLKLSEDRAKAVKQYLVKKGIAVERLIAKGYGDTQPVDDNSTPTGRQKNRRTEAVIISQ